LQTHAYVGVVERLEHNHLQGLGGSLRRCRCCCCADLAARGPSTCRRGAHAMHPDGLPRPVRAWSPHLITRIAQRHEYSRNALGGSDGDQRLGGGVHHQPLVPLAVRCHRLQAPSHATSHCACRSWHTGC
jgi:hypothetical protein